MTKHRYCCALVFCAACTGVFGQAYDRTWITGMHEFPGTPGYNNALIRFSADTISVQEQGLKMNFESTVGVMSDSAGELLFYTNGCAIAGADGAIMAGGEGLNPGEMHDWVCDKTGYVCPRGAMALPKPGSTTRYVLVHAGARYDPVRKLTYGPFYATEIDMALNGDKGAVISKNIVLTDGDLEPFTAVRHGNGRDWWLVVPVYASAEYRVFLFSPDGISGPLVQKIGQVMDCRRIGTSVFSLNGEKFARAQNCQVAVLDFDRCSGEFSNPTLLDLPDHVVGGGGVAFSPDSRRLLVSTQLQILEADLSQPLPVLDSAFTWNYQWGVSLQHMQYTPNGGILLNHMHRTDYMSLIKAPNEPGSAMQFVPKGVDLPVFSVRSLPNFPNFRLYDLPGSPCDTLGIDGPVVGLTTPLLPEGGLRMYPNPAADAVQIAFEGGAPPGVRVSVTDLTGRVLSDAGAPAGTEVQAVSLVNCPAGLYFVRVEAAGRLLWVKKLSVIK